MKPIIIQRKKSRDILLIICGLAFTVVSALMLITDSFNNTFGFGVIERVFLTIGMLFFGMCTIILVKMAAQSKPLLIINDKGIVDNSSAVAVGLIAWDDIADASIVNVMGQKFIELIVKNDDKYLERLNASQKAAALANKKVGFSTININTGGSKLSSEQLLKIIKSELNRRNNEQTNY